MSNKQHESNKVFVKYRLDESSKITAKKLEIQNFRESVTKSAEILQSHKSGHVVKMPIQLRVNEQARLECIKHWQHMLDLTIADIQADREAPTPQNCAFCKLYFYFACKGCPIATKTGRMGCEGTPYTDASVLYERISNGSTEPNLDEHDLIKFHKSVRQMLKFLKNL